MDELKLSLLQSDKEGVLEALRTLPHIPDAVAALKQEGIHLVLELCKKGFTDVIEFLIAQDIDILDTDFQESPIQVACRYNQVEVLEFLLLRDYPILPKNVKVWHEASPLYIASKCGHYTIAQKLLEKEPRLIKKDNVRSCLLYAACLGGSIPTMKLWLTPGLDVNHPLQLVQTLDDCEKKTPLYAACSRGHSHLVEFLRQNFKDVQLTDIVCNAYPDVIGEFIKEQFFPVYSNKNSTAADEDDDDDIFQLCCGRLRDMNLHILHPSWLLPHSVTLVELDISDNFLTELPSCLPWNFQNLRVFTAMRNQLKSLAAPKESYDEDRCPSLEELNLSYNKLDSVCRDVFYIQSLKLLNLSHNELPYLVRSVHHIGVHQYNRDAVLNRQSTLPVPWLCYKLLKLDVSYNVLEMLPGEITGCRGLVELNAKNNKLITFPQPWDCPLVTLDLSENKLERFPVNTEQYWCSSLKLLNIAGNMLDEINEGIVKLSVLTDLNASNNRIERLPAPDVWECGHLHQLNLKHNRLGMPREHSPAVKSPFKVFSPREIKKKIKRMSLSESASRPLQFPEFLSNCLKELRLADNNLDHVPPSICDLKMIEVLDLSNNPLIKSLPKELGMLKNCGMLKLKDLSLDNVSQEFCTDQSNKTREILSGLLESLRECKPYNKVKTVVLGKKDKGKTTLVNLLAGRKQRVMERSSIVKEEITLCKGKGSFPSPFSSEKQPDIKLTVWDISGDDSYTLIHHSVFTPHSLYILVWDFWSISQEMDKIGQWLYNIEASTPYFNVILVGTFFDKMTLKTEEKDQAVQKLQDAIDSKFPNLHRRLVVCPVSCINNEGIEALKSVLYKTALAMKLPGRRGSPLIGRKIPKSYLRLESIIVEEKKLLVSNNEPPFLTQTQFNDILERLPAKDNDILTSEECTAVTKFLVDTGTLLHFSDQLGALNTLYFLDPAWLCDVLVHVLISEEGKRLLTTGRGQISITDVERIYREDERFPDPFISQYIELLERFEIAISVTMVTPSQNLFFPCHLPNTPPMMNPPHYADAREIRRLYRMAECPSGFWTRLLSRMMTRVEQFTTSDWFHKPTMTQSMRKMSLRHIALGVSNPNEISRTNSFQGLHIKNPTKTFCREWLYVQHADGSFCVEPVTCAEARGDNMLQKGVLITVVNTAEDFSIMGIIVDEIEDIIQDYYPGLLEPDEWTMQNRLERYALCSTCYQDNPPSRDVNHFTMEHCARMLVHGNFISCPQGVKHELQTLVPDLLMKELPNKLILDTSKLELHETQENFLGGGVTGSVFRAKYKGEAIAMKVYRSDIRNKPRNFENNALHSNNSDSGMSTMSTQGSIAEQATVSEDYENFQHRACVDLDEAESIKALRALREMRQEVVLTSRLQHPCIVSLTGIALSPKLMMALELAPLGSLRNTLDEKLSTRPVFNKYKHKDMVFDTLFDKEMTFKLVYQIAKGLDYLHSNGIIYKDLKSDNILTMSLDPMAPVNVKLSDYGISKYCWSGRSVGLVGTPGYQAPEILDGLAYDEKVDIFAFSMVIYEILSGRRPFSEYENLGQITKALKTEGKRPNVKEFNVQTQFPYLEDLMTQCWQKKASDRPTAAKIVSKRGMQNVQFLAQNAKFKMDDSQTFLPDCVLGTSDDSNQSGLLWIWEGCGSSRCLSILNLERASFRVFKMTFEGPRVLCMAIVDKHCWIGTEAGEIEKFGTEQDGSIKQLCKVQLEALPVQILAVQQQELHGVKMFSVYVSLENANLKLYQSKPPKKDSVEKRRPTLKKMEGFKDQLSLVLRSEKIYCMTLANQNSELWVSNSGHIDIVNCADFKVVVGERINLAILNMMCNIPQKFNVCQMVSSEGKMFCLLQRSPFILEFCESSYFCVSVINLGAKQVYRSMVLRQLNFSQSDHEAYHGVTTEDFVRDRNDSGDRNDSTDDDEEKMPDGQFDDVRSFKMPDGQFDDVKSFWASTKDQGQESSKVQGEAKDSLPHSPVVPPRRAHGLRPVGLTKTRPATSFNPGNDSDPTPPPVVRRSPRPLFSYVEQADQSTLVNDDLEDDNSYDPPIVPPRSKQYTATPKNTTLGTFDEKNKLTAKSSFSLPTMNLSDEFDIEATSIEIVGKSLWVGRSHGDICIVEMNRPLVKQTNQNLGRVVAVMYDLRHNKTSKQSEEGVKLVKSGNCIASAYTLSSDDSSMVEIASWECYNADNISRVEKYWSTLMSIEKSLILQGRAGNGEGLRIGQDIPEQF